MGLGSDEGVHGIDWWQVAGIAMVVIISISYLTLKESSFGYRCKKGFPEATYIQHEQCVDHLSNGGMLKDLEAEFSKGQ